MQKLSMIWGILAVLGLIVAFTPCLGGLNWLNIPFSGVGLVISLIALVKPGATGSRTGSIVGVICCGLSIIIGIIRLVLGGGVL